MAPASSKEFLDIQANCRVWIHSETRTWHDNNIQLEKLLIFNLFVNLQDNGVESRQRRSVERFNDPMYPTQWYLVRQLILYNCFLKPKPYYRFQWTSNDSVCVWLFCVVGS